jgi:hypothetical protein
MALMTPAAAISLAAALLPTPLRVPHRSSRIAMRIEGMGWGPEKREELLFKNLLCQRAIQTQLHLFAYLNNEVQSDWLMDFAEEKGSARLCTGNRQVELMHSHMAMAAPWNEFLVALMDAHDETIEIEVAARRIGGGSPDNPYLPKPKPTIYTDTISPSTIGQNLLRIREQLAKEWEQDLQLLPLCNAELRRHHSEEVVNVSDAVENLQYQIVPGSIEGEDGAESPLRSANFDLLKTAVTHAALWRLQKELDVEPTQKHAAEWLALFAREHGSAFRGGAYGLRAGREFLLKMMDQPVKVSKSLGGKPRFVDPLSMAERLMDLREELALEWSEAMQHVPAEHVLLRVEEHRAKLEGAIVPTLRSRVESPPPPGFAWAEASEPEL